MSGQHGTVRREGEWQHGTVRREGEWATRYCEEGG